MSLRFGPTIAMAAAIALFAGCGGDSDPDPEPPRPQDSRSFTPVDAAATTFAALAPAAGDTTDVTTTSRWAGVREGAAYRVEVPATWNGILVMYAHGYAGTGADLAVSNPSIRRYLVDNGYAWAASSYTKNYYDVRAGVEDTNSLALAFEAIASANGRALPRPSKYYITGHSMGGHITGAAIEAETQQTVRSFVRYAGAVPMCGVMGDTQLFDEFGAVQMAAQAIVGQPDVPVDEWDTIVQTVTGTLFSSFPTPAAPTAPITPTSTGLVFASVLQNLTGGPRPLFNFGLSFGGSFPFLWGALGGDGTIDGILNETVLDTTDVTYAISGDPAGSAALNAGVQRLTPVADANRPRRDGLRWIPQVQGRFDVPVVSIHTLGDLFVPFSMQQAYANRAAANGNADRLVQRAIRGASHCDFTVAEQVAAFDAMVRWERDGVKPAGDDVLTPATVAQPTYGCTFTDNTLGPDESGTTQALRPSIVGAAPCP